MFPSCLKASLFFSLANYWFTRWPASSADIVSRNYLKIFTCRRIIPCFALVVLYVCSREYWMICRETGFLAWFCSLPNAHPLTPHPIAGPATHRKAGKERQFADGRGEKWMARTRREESYDRKNAWSFVNHLILSGMQVLFQMYPNPSPPPHDDTGLVNPVIYLCIYMICSSTYT